MTGYGRGEGAQDGLKITVEVSSVNRKQTEIALYLPRELEPLEPQVRDELNRRISRGRLTVRVAMHTAESKPTARVRLNTAIAGEYARELRRLAKELGLNGALPLDVVARAPGVMQTEEILPDASVYWSALGKALRQAVAGLITMRQREGAHLSDDLALRMSALRKATAQIRKRAPLVAKRYRQQLHARLQSAGLERAEIEQQRVLQEIVLFADRADISEELTRLESHFQQFEHCLKAAEPVGRTLDFLAQEMHREVNTIGSKANDSLISRQVVIMKAELEKFREQVQNVE